MIYRGFSCVTATGLKEWDDITYGLEMAVRLIFSIYWYNNRVFKNDTAIGIHWIANVLLK